MHIVCTRAVSAALIISALLIPSALATDLSGSPDSKLVVDQAEHDQALLDGTWPSHTPQFLAANYTIPGDCAIDSTTLTEPRESQHTLEDGISALASYLRDEIHIKGLLSDLDVTGGAALLRDLALRTRSFKKAFRAWEDLHLVAEDGSLLAQNVIPRLRSSKVLNLKMSIDTYDEFRVFINRLGEKLFPWTLPYYADLMSFHASFSGRGLVFTTGDGHAPYLLTSIPAMRQLGCHLPIEIMYLGDEDLNEENRELLEALSGVITRDMSRLIDDDGWQLKGWAAKPFAILFSSFREVIFIDADALFFQNPQVLFADKDYARAGALFFHDRKLSPEFKRSLLREVLPKPISQHVKTNCWWTGESGHVQDSGVVVVDKREHFVPLLLTTRLNGPDRDANDATGKKGVYDLMYGDKETFWLSWEMVGSEDYAFHDGAVGTMGSGIEHGTATMQDHQNHGEDEEHDDDEGEDEDEKGGPSPASSHSAATICSSQLLHFDLEGKPLWWNGWIATNKYEGPSYKRFTNYMKEEKAPGSPWTLKDSNVACLTSTEHAGFSEKDQKMIDALVDSAQQSQAL